MTTHPDPATTKDRTFTVPGLAGYAIGGVVWLGLAALGAAGDCGPDSTDGQCGMSTFFGSLYGLGVGGAIVGGTWLATAPRRRAAPEHRRFRRAAASSFLAGLAALVVVVFVLVARDEPADAAGAVIAHVVRLSPLIGFVAAPHVFAVVFTIAFANYVRRRSDRGSTLTRSCATGAAAGTLVGLVVPSVIGMMGWSRTAVIALGTWVGIAAGWAFWRVAERAEPGAGPAGRSV